MREARKKKKFQPTPRSGGGISEKCQSVRKDPKTKKAVETAGNAARKAVYRWPQLVNQKKGGTPAHAKAHLKKKNS